MAWNIFKKKIDSDSPENDNLDIKIDAALKKAQADKRAAASEIEKIKMWIAEVIVETYADAFPNGHLTYYREKYKDEALEKYESIKEQNQGKIQAENAEKCDRIVKGYLNQIELRKSKVLLYEKLETEYAATKQKLKQAVLKKKSDDKVTSHEQRLKQLDDDTSSYVNALNDTDELSELKREFELKSEYMNQLTLLSDKYNTQADDSYDNSLAYKQEIDKILNDM